MYVGEKEGTNPYAYNIFSSGSIVLVSMKSSDRMESLLSILDDLVVNKGMGGVIISVSGPYEMIYSEMEEAGIPPEDVHFIDCISLMAGKLMGEKSDRAVFVENPSSLEEISMYLDRMLLNVESDKKFLILDSLSSLMIYNSEKTVKEFGHFLINKVRLADHKGILMSIERKGTEGLVHDLIPMCDAAIRWTDEYSQMLENGMSIKEALIPKTMIQGKRTAGKVISAVDSFRRSWGDYLEIRL